MTKLTDLKAILSRIDTATDNIAADIRALAAKIGTGLTDAEVSELQTDMEAAAVKLDATAAETPDEPQS